MHHIARQFPPLAIGTMATMPGRRLRRLALVLLAAVLVMAGLGATSARASTVPVHPEPGVYSISPEHTLGTSVLDVAGAATGPAAIIQWKKYGASGNANQQFRLEKVPTELFTPVYRIKPQHVSDMCLDIAYASADPGGKLIQHGCNGQKNQQFFISRAFSGSNAYAITPRHSGLYVEVPNRSYALGVQLEQNLNVAWPDVPPDFQRFILTKISN